MFRLLLFFERVARLISSLLLSRRDYVHGYHISAGPALYGMERKERMKNEDELRCEEVKRRKKREKKRKNSRCCCKSRGKIITESVLRRNIKTTKAYHKRASPFALLRNICSAHIVFASRHRRCMMMIVGDSKVANSQCRRDHMQMRRRKKKRNVNMSPGQGCY